MLIIAGAPKQRLLTQPYRAIDGTTPAKITPAKSVPRTRRLTRPVCIASEPGLYLAHEREREREREREPTALGRGDSITTSSAGDPFRARPQYPKVKIDTRAGAKGEGGSESNARLARQVRN